MKEFKGTPGPWNYCAEEPDWVTDSNDNIAVARVTRYNTDAEAQHANAKLISAAPELLEALQSLINDYDDFRERTGHTNNPQNKMILNAKSAIKKALGEKQ
jgi:lactate dehydrogenase-like 2-hydroxyacid dehydrogenase